MTAATGAVKRSGISVLARWLACFCMEVDRTRRPLWLTFCGKRFCFKCAEKTFRYVRSPTHAPWLCRGAPQKNCLLLMIKGSIFTILYTTKPPSRKKNLKSMGGVSAARAHTTTKQQRVHFSATSSSSAVHHDVLYSYTNRLKV